MARYRLTVDIDRDSPTPVYQQIADHIRSDIEAGKIKPGQRIPSLVQLQEDTDGCTLITIRNGIKLLVKDGYVRIVPGKGTFVNPPTEWPNELVDAIIRAGGMIEQAPRNRMKVTGPSGMIELPVPSTAARRKRAAAQIAKAAGLKLDVP